MKNTKRAIAVLVAVSMMIGCAIGGVMAWFIDETPAVTNTFTVGNVDIELDESKLKEDGTLDTAERVQGNSFKMIPGWTIEKDPVVTVKENSEDCWVFIKVADNFGVTEDSSTDPATITEIEKITIKGKEYTFDQFIDYSIDTTKWTPLDSVTNVYYCEAKDLTSDKKITILTNNQVTVDENVTKEMMDGLTQANYPKLTFTAYAVQMYETNDDAFTAAEAWAKIPTT